MGGTDTSGASSTPVRIGAVALLAAPVLVAFAVPLLGIVGSLLLPLIAARVRSRLWPAATRRAVYAGSALAVLGLWFPLLTMMLSQGSIAVPGMGTVWLLIPLCAPVGAAAWLAPALVATAVTLVGAVVSVLVRRPWPWVVTAWLAPMAYDAAGRLSPVADMLYC